MLNLHFTALPSEREWVEAGRISGGCCSHPGERRLSGLGGGSAVETRHGFGGTLDMGGSDKMAPELPVYVCVFVVALFSKSGPSGRRPGVGTDDGYSLDLC